MIIFCTIIKLRLLNNWDTQEKNNEEIQFRLLLLAKSNKRLNTIFLLFNSNNFDGIFPLVRTLFELNLSFKPYIDSSEKLKYMNFYSFKSSYEMPFKTERCFPQTSNQLFTDLDKKIRVFLDSANNIAKEEKINKYKTRYEIASEKSIYELSKEYLSDKEYYICYDILSNWVHPQSLLENISLNQKLTSMYSIEKK